MNELLRNAFYEEADELFQEIEDCLLEIDAHGSTKTNIECLFRYMHTLKGSSAAMGIDDMAKITHGMEDILGMVRDSEVELTRELISVMLESLDALRQKVDKHKIDMAYEINVDQILSSLECFKADQENGMNRICSGSKKYPISSKPLQENNFSNPDYKKFKL